MFFYISLLEKQIRAWDSPNWRLGPNRGFKFGCHLGSNSINFQTWSNYLPKRSTLSVDYENVIFWSVEVTWPQIRGIWGHLGSKPKHFQTRTNYISKWSSWFHGYEKMVFEVDRLRGMWDHLGSKSKTFETLTVHIPKWSSCSRDNEKVVLEVSRGHPTPNFGYFGSFGVTIQIF